MANIKIWVRSVDLRADKVLQRMRLRGQKDSVEVNPNGLKVLKEKMVRTV